MYHLLLGVVFVGMGLVLSESAVGHANREVWQNAESAIQDFKNVSQCSSRIWPNFSYAGVTVVVVNEKRAQQLAIDLDSRQVYRIKNEDLPGGAFATYSFFEFKGRKAISVNQNYSTYVTESRSVFALGSHESFHFLGQKNWAGRSSGRGDFIPVRWEPRYYRAMLQKNLKAAFFDRQNQIIHLRHAKFWFAKWTSEFPNESLATTDGYEGTAEYAEIIAKALATAGCNASESTLRSYAKKAVESSPDLLKSDYSYALDHEGYYVGSLAALILRFDRLEAWTDRMSKGETPVEVLLENISALEQKSSERDVTKFKMLASDKQREVVRKIAPATSVMNYDFTYVWVPGEWQLGALGYDGFFIDSKNGTMYSVISDPVSLRHKENVIEIKAGIVSVDPASHPCEGWGWNIPVLTVAVTQSSDGLFQIKTPRMRGTLRGTLKKDELGNKWLCPALN